MIITQEVHSLLVTNNSTIQSNRSHYLLGVGFCGVPTGFYSHFTGYQYPAQVS